MNSTQPVQSGNAGSVGQAVRPGSDEILRREREPQKPAAAPQFRPKRTGYGLPCAKCRAYYAADQTECPVCKATERVSPTAVSRVIAVDGPVPEDCGDYAALEAERERFLQEFKSQIYAAHMHRCGGEPPLSKEENHRVH